MEENRQVVAYGQVELNRTAISLNTTDDYHKLAKKFFDNAMGYYDLCKAAAPTLHPVSMALHTNACLACELFLKTLLLAEEYDFYHQIKRPGDKHDLYELYSRLSEEGKKCIKNSKLLHHTDSFDDRLKDIGKGFEVIRYIAECNGMMVDVYFLYNFMCTLAGICKYIVNQL